MSTRFDATTISERRELIADAIGAHRTRSSPFLTIEADPSAIEGDSNTIVNDPNTIGDDTDDGEAELGVPWVQYTESQRPPDEESETVASHSQRGVINLDCTEAELERVKTLCETASQFTVVDVSRPEAAGGSNVRVGTTADAERTAVFIDELFCEVYELPAEFRAWVAEV